MATKLDELLETLHEMIELLEENGEQRWSKWMRQSRDWLLDSDFSGIEHLLSAYGGMGSFNDLVIGQRYENGEFRWKENYSEMNNKLNEFRKKAWELADAIRRDHTLSDS